MEANEVAQSAEKDALAEQLADVEEAHGSAILDLADARDALHEACGLLVRAERRIRHDHGYPMEVGAHHCEGCDLEAAIRALIKPLPPGATS
jgi:hypothetical protein